jgi:hypothetical protein
MEVVYYNDAYTFCYVAITFFLKIHEYQFLYNEGNFHYIRNKPNFTE